MQLRNSATLLRPVALQPAGSFSRTILTSIAQIRSLAIPTASRFSIVRATRCRSRRLPTSLSPSRGRDNWRTPPYPDKLRTMIDWFKQGGVMDFQRIPGHGPNPQYQDFTNYVFGAVTNAAGVSPSVSFPAALGYNAVSGRWRPGFLGTPVENIKMWTQGWEDHVNGKLDYP